MRPEQGQRSRRIDVEVLLPLVRHEAPLPIDLLITSVLDTSPVTSSSCLDPSSASTKSSTFTVLSANKIFENRCSTEDQKKKEMKSTSGSDYIQD